MDPNFAPAWASLAEALTQRREARLGQRDKAEVGSPLYDGPRTRPNLAEAHAALGLIGGDSSTSTVAHWSGQSRLIRVTRKHGFG